MCALIIYFLLVGRASFKKIKLGAYYTTELWNKK